MSKPGFLSIMTDFAHQQKSDWFLLEFSKDGFIGVFVFYFDHYYTALLE